MITQAILDADQAAIDAAKAALQRAQDAVLVAQAALSDAQAKLAADVAQAQAEAHPILAVLDDIAARVEAQSEVLGVDFETAFAALVAKARAMFPNLTLPPVAIATPTTTIMADAPSTDTTTTTAIATTAPQVDPSPAPVPETVADGSTAGAVSSDSSAPAADPAQQVAA